MKPSIAATILLTSSVLCAATSCEEYSTAADQLDFLYPRAHPVEPLKVDDNLDDVVIKSNNHIFKLLNPWSKSVISGQRTEGPVELYQHTPQIIPQIMFETDTKETKRNKALLALLQAHENDCLNATELIADSLFFGKFNLQRNTTLAFSFYSKATSSYSNRMMGLMYATGLGIAQDYSKAVLYLNFASLKGDLIATQALGYYHLTGIATLKNCVDSIWFYKRVADAAYHTYLDGPPLGKSLPESHVLKISDTNGGIYGHGASGPGNPMLQNQNSQQSALRPEDVLLHYEYLADKGDANAQLVFGHLLYIGTANLPQDFNRAFAYFQQCARRYPSGAVAAALKAGVSSPEYKLLSKAIKSSAKASADATSYVGIHYWRGEGVFKDEKLARQWFERGVEWGSAASMNALGIMLLHGTAGFTADAKKAKQYFIQSAAALHPDGQASLAEMFFVEHDFPSALKYFTLASRQGHTMSLYRLAQMYSQGLGVAQSCHLGVGFYKNMVEKADWHVPYARDAKKMMEAGDNEGAFINFALSAELGYEDSQTNVAWIIDREIFNCADLLGSLPDISAPRADPYLVALTFWNRAANQGNVDARVKMGDYHYYGLGISSRQPAAAASILEPLLNTVPPLLYKYFGVGYVTTGGQPDYEKAALYYQVAAESEHSALAMWDLGFMHEHGLGLPQDFHLAKRFYDQSLATNPEAYFPVKLSLLKLGVKMLWKSIALGDFSLFSNDGDDDQHNLPPIREIDSTIDDSDEGDGSLLNFLIMCTLLYIFTRYGNAWLARANRVVARPNVAREIAATVAPTSVERHQSDAFLVERQDSKEATMDPVGESDNAEASTSIDTKARPSSSSSE